MENKLDKNNLNSLLFHFLLLLLTEVCVDNYLGEMILKREPVSERNLYNFKKIWINIFHRPTRASIRLILLVDTYLFAKLTKLYVKILF